MNHIVLMGRLCADPELRHTQSGVPVASFRLAVNRPFKSDGETKADFISCVAWRGTGEFISKYFTKGQMCAVSGSLQIRDWEDKNGNKRQTAEVIVNQAYFCEGKKFRDEQHDSDQAGDFEELDDDGELPF